MGRADKKKDSFEETLLIMDAVDELRRQEEYFNQKMDSVTDAEEMKERLRKLYKQSDIDVSDEILDKAVKAKQEERFTYHPPEKSMSARLALAYINRKRAIPYAVMASVIIGFLSSLHFMFVTVPHHFKVKNMVTSVSSSINSWESDANKQKEAIAAQTAALESIKDVPKSVEQVVDSKKLEVKLSLSEASGLMQLASNMKKPKKVDSSNIEELYNADVKAISDHATALNAVSSKMSGVSRQISEIRTLVGMASKYEAVKINKKDLVPVIAQRAKDAYDRGLDALSTGDLKVASQSLNEVKSALNLQATYGSIQNRINEAVALVKENHPTADTLNTIGQLRSVAEHNLSIADATGADAATKELEAKAQEAIMDLRLVVVTRGKSGVWRYPLDNRTAKNYYLIVNAEQPNGDIVPIQIKSEETGAMSTVKMFGVRVSKSVYEQVKADKLDNGIIEHNVVAHKPRGSFKYEHVLDIQDGRITSW